MQINETKCGDAGLKKKLRDIEDAGGLVISVMWREFPFRDYVIVYRENI